MSSYTVFAWDAAKADSNERKHGVGFDEATSAFLDQQGLYLPEPGNPSGDERFVLLGRSGRFRILVVCYCYREEEHVIRIISARKASPGETSLYVEHFHV